MDTSATIREFIARNFYVPDKAALTDDASLLDRGIIDLAAIYFLILCRNIRPRTQTQRDVIARGVFTTVKDLDRKLMRYIRQYNLAPKPVKWVYRTPTHRITTDSRVTVH
jgi:hypothetical protein